MAQKLILSIGLILTLMWLTGCETMETRKQANRLSDTLRAYSAALRWGQFEQVYGFRKTDSGQLETPPESLNNIRISSYDIISAPAIIGDDTAVQTIGIEYILQDSQSVKQLIDQQVWGYDAENKVWFLKSPVPTFK